MVMIDLQVDSAGDFLYVKQYTDDAVEAILDGARKLQDLSMRNQSLITLKSPWFRRGFVNRAGHFSLRKLDLYGCDFLHPRSAAAVFSHCSDLEHVILSRRLPSLFRGKKFWNASFKYASYSMTHEEMVLMDREREKEREMEEEGMDKHNHRHSSQKRLGTANTSRTNTPYSDYSFGPTDNDNGQGMVGNMYNRASSTRSDWSMRSGGSGRLSITSEEDESGKIVVDEDGMDGMDGRGVGGGGGGGGSLDDRITTGSRMNSASIVSTRNSISGGRNNVSGGRNSRNNMVSGGRKLTMVAEEITINDIIKIDHTELHILRPHPKAEAWRFRDKFIRTRLQEFHAVRVIEQARRVQLMWRRIGRNVSAHKIACWCTVLMNERKRRKLVKAFVLNRSAKVIQRCYRQHDGGRAKQCTKIQRIARGYIARQLAKQYRKRLHASLIIQKRMRGALVRSSNQYFMMQMYLALPQFWRKLFRYAPFQPQYEMTPNLSFQDVVRKGNFPHDTTLVSYPHPHKLVDGTDVFGHLVNKPGHTMNYGLHGAGVVGGSSTPIGTGVGVGIGPSSPTSSSVVSYRETMTRPDEVKDLLGEVQDIRGHIKGSVLSMYSSQRKKTDDKQVRGD